VEAKRGRKGGKKYRNKQQLRRRNKRKGGRPESERKKESPIIVRKKEQGEAEKENGKQTCGYLIPGKRGKKPRGKGPSERREELDHHIALWEMAMQKGKRRER